MDINGWNYLFENLPHWRIREHFPYVYDQLTQSVTGKYAILIYSIAEVTMCNEVGCLAVSKPRASPPATERIQSPFSSSNSCVFCEWPVYVFEVTDVLIRPKSSGMSSASSGSV